MCPILASSWTYPFRDAIVYYRFALIAQGNTFQTTNMQKIQNCYNAGRSRKTKQYFCVFPAYSMVKGCYLVRLCNSIVTIVAPNSVVLRKNRTHLATIWMAEILAVLFVATVQTYCCDSSPSQSKAEPRPRRMVQYYKPFLGGNQHSSPSKRCSETTPKAFWTFYVLLSRM